MSKDVDALVLIGHGYKISEEAMPSNHSAVSQALWRIRNGRTKQNDGEPITEETKASLFASEIFLNLGDLAASQYFQQPLRRPLEFNPFYQSTLGVIKGISPLGPKAPLRPEFAIDWPIMTPLKNGLPQMFEPALKASPFIEEGLKNKWDKAHAVHVRRGKVAILGYATQDVIEQLSKLDVDEIAPDEVAFDAAGRITHQTHYVSALLDKTNLQPQPAEVGYYQTFDIDKKHGVAMLTHALEDLTQVSKAIR